MSLIACNKCGKEYSNFASKCPNCGNETYGIEVTATKKDSSLKKYGLIALLISALIFVAGFLFYLNSNFYKGNTAMEKGDFEIAITYFEQSNLNLLAKNKIENCRLGLAFEKEIDAVRKELANMENYLNAIKEGNKRNEYLYGERYSLIERNRILSGGYEITKSKEKYLIKGLEEIKKGKYKEVF